MPLVILFFTRPAHVLFFFLAPPHTSFFFFLLLSLHAILFTRPWSSSFSHPFYTPLVIFFSRPFYMPPGHPLFYTPLVILFFYTPLVIFLHADPPIHLQGEKPISLSYGHTQLNPPHPVRSAKLNSRWQSQYYGGGPHGNTLCCSFFLCFLFFLSLIFFFHSALRSLPYIYRVRKPYL